MEHESLRPADPIVRAGANSLAGRPVRWVHSSEVLDIASLLRGGELLLSGGTALSAATSARRHRYIRELAANHVTALGVETGPDLPELPADLIRAAVEVDLPLIELRRVVPFVEVAESINSVLVSDSVSMLQRADDVSHAVAVELANGAGLRQLLEVIASELAVSVSLLVPGTLSTELLGVAGKAADPGAPVQTIDVGIPLRGIIAATLRMDVVVPKQVSLARVVGERVVDVLALALLQQRPPSLGDIAGVELIRAVAADERESALVDMCGPAGFRPDAPVVMLSARANDTNRLRSLVGRVLLRTAERAVPYANPGEVIAVVALSNAGGHRSRAALVADLRNGIGELNAAICIGPMVESIRGAAYSLAQARLTLELAAASASRAEVFDSDGFVVDRMIAENLSSNSKSRLVGELLGELLAHDARRGTRLGETLEAWLRSGCNTAETARTLYLERQSLHNRLQRIFALIGGDPRNTGRIAGLVVALRVARQIPSKYH
ncbi:PucR family transcriptional regulator [Spelaeicoccus albus]|uniref:Purine catabolism regulator n=1 Tax=Spelaeicoccus albus TaxID=1280376 RepID=A0A7Z0D1X8_9MICO|nr:PucR family transcriptional regulator [Spelaeicoccus albus]NYI67182.1 purine catabolism regulator [Spelaeicoccus albus]